MQRNRARSATRRDDDRAYRPLLPLVAALAAIWITSACTQVPSPVDTRSPSASGPARGYNLLLVTLDTVRADHLGVYGDAEARTPVIDRLAATGLRFTNVTAATPITLPSHTTIMTGLDARSHGVRNNGTYRLDDAKVTLAEQLHRVGYRTAAFIGSFVLDSRYGLDQGFELYDDAVDPRIDRSVRAGNYHERRADAVTDAALEWLADGAEGATPFFVWLHYFDAHAPHEAPAPWAAAHPGRPYDGEIAFVDAQLGRVLDALEERGILDRTLVVLTSDHGEGLGDHGESTHSLLLYESTMHVPLIFSCPSLYPGPRVVDDRLVGQVDIVPTVLDLLGVSRQAPTDGIDVLRRPPKPDRAIYIESMVPLLDYGWAPLTGLRRLDDKYIEAPTPEYYVLSERPLEGRNRYESSEEVDRLRKRLAELRSGSPSPDELVADEPALDADTARALAALGYVRSPVSPAARAERKDPKEMLEEWNAMSQAQILEGIGRHEEAERLLRNVLKQDPGNARAWYVLSNVLRRADRFREAEDALRQALRLAPTGEGWIRLAQFLLKRGDYDAFRAAIGQARRLEPDNGQIEITLGDRLAIDGRFEEAIEHFRNAIEVDPVRTGGIAQRKIVAAERRIQRGS